MVDTLNDAHLASIGRACRELKLITGGSGLAAGIAQNWANALSDQSVAMQAGQPGSGSTVILSGSCSVMTNRQVAAYQSQAAHFALDVKQCLCEPAYIEQVLDWVISHLNDPLAPMVYATAQPHTLHAIQAEFGAQASSQAVEQFFHHLVQRLQQHGVSNFIVAGGETSGVVTQSLNVRGFYIGPQIAPGVPWVKAIDQPLSLALKSGNFGDEHFFTSAQGFIHD